MSAVCFALRSRGLWNSRSAGDRFPTRLFLVQGIECTFSILTVRVRSRTRKSAISDLEKRGHYCFGLTDNSQELTRDKWQARVLFEALEDSCPPSEARTRVRAFVYLEPY